MNLKLQSHRRLLGIALLIGALLLAGVARTSTANAGMEFNERVILDDDFDGCSGERIRVQGIQHIVGSLTTDSAGRQHFSFTRNTQGKGIGQISGGIYIFTDSVSRTSFESAPGEFKTFTQQYQTQLIRRGEGASPDDAILHMLTHITLSPEGIVTAMVELLRVECR